MTQTRPVSKNPTEEAYDFGELDGFPATAVLHGDKYFPQSKRATLNILSAASAMLDISTKHSPQTTSTSAVSNHTASCRSTPSAAFQSPFQSPSAGNQSWGAHMTTNHQTATSYNTEGELKSLENKGMHNTTLGSMSKSEHVSGKLSDPKILRRLAQNREAARKSRLRKKAYVQQLEASRTKLNQMEQELIRVRQQGVLTGGAFYNDMSTGGNGLIGPHNTGAAAFNLEYAHWLDEKSRQMGDLRTALRTHLSDDDLQVLVESLMSHYDEIFQRKSVAVKADVFHLLSGMWKTPAERCFMWMGGFRPSEILKILLPQIEPLTEQQLMGIYNLQQSSQQAEDALSQGMETLQQTLAETLAWGPLDSPDSIMSTYLSQMAIAMGKLGTLESFIRQADHLRQQTLKQMQRLLTIQQMARGLLAMGEYFNRLRALSSLWLARPKD